TDEQGNPIDVRDPLADEFKARTAGKTSAPALLQAYLGMEQIFGSDLPESAAFRDTVGKALVKLMGEGAARTVAGF
ncbi:fructuronate reductase, partial [Salmonella enterica subsp. enterica serovar Oranienburg]|nr:fructuronate reductase [Salmonella enterica subsp. enterica serovar Oranienburg]